MRKVLPALAALVVTGLAAYASVGATGTMGTRDDQTHHVLHFYKNGSGQTIGYHEQHCTGDVSFWGTLEGAVTHMTSVWPCQPEPICEEVYDYGWYTIDGGGPYCIRASLAQELEENCFIVESGQPSPTVDQPASESRHVHPDRP